VACDGCPPLADLVARYEAAGGQYLVCALCCNAKGLDADQLLPNAKVGGTIPFWAWIGDGATSFSFRRRSGHERAGGVLTQRIAGGAVGT